MECFMFWQNLAKTLMEDLLFTSVFATAEKSNKYLDGTSQEEKRSLVVATKKPQGKVEAKSTENTLRQLTECGTE